MEVHVRLSVINIANVCSCAWHGNGDDMGVMTSPDDMGVMISQDRLSESFTDRLLESFAFLTPPLSRPTALDVIFRAVHI